MSHAVRPESYSAINNFYTSTVYEKGAEVVRMYDTLLGRDGFVNGVKHYLDQHDGTAATCDDFRRAMSDANGGVDLSKFERWYCQSGTPRLIVRGTYDSSARTYTLNVTQDLSGCKGAQVQPGDPDFSETEKKFLDPEPFHMPIAMGLLSSNGQSIPLKLVEPDADAERSLSYTNAEHPSSIVLNVTDMNQSFTFTDVVRSVNDCERRCMLH